MKKFLSLVLALVTVVSCCFFAACSSETPSTTAPAETPSTTAPATVTPASTIKIGVSGPLTGDAAQYGIGVQNAANMAIAEVNAAGGLFGQKFELVSVDDAAESSKVATTYSTMMSKGVVVSLGCVTSGACAEFVKLSKEDSLFFITPSASNDDVPNEANGYQMCFADGNQGSAAAAYVNAEYKGKTIGIVYQSGDNYSQGIYEQFVDNLDSSVTTKVASFAKDATDFSSQVAIVKDCEFVFLPIYYTPASQFMLESLKHENSMKVFYGCDGLDGINSIEGFDLNTIPQEVSYLSHFNAASTDTATKTFVDKYVEKYNDTPSQFAAAAYDCVYAIKSALEKAGESKVKSCKTAEDYCKVLTEQFDGSFTFSGVTGSGMKWTRKTSGKGYVEKSATKYVVKASTLG